MIHICFGIYDKDGRYSKFAGTSIASIFDNTNAEVTIHILHDNTMTIGNFEKFVYLAGKYGQQIKFYNVEKTCADKINELRELMSTMNESERFTIGATYRLILSQVIPAEISKILYFDTDIITNCDVKELWNVDIEKFTIAAVTEFSNGMDPQAGLPMCRDGFVKDEDYFNSGVLLINMERMRKEGDNLNDGVQFRIKHPDYIHFDQDILNYCFSTNYLKLPTKFNAFVRYERRLKRQVAAKIYHYLGTSYGGGIAFNQRDPFNKLWFSYFVKTPWFNAEAISHIYDGVRQLQHDLQNRAIGLSKSLAGKRRVFFTPAGNVDALKKIYLVEDNEEIIVSTNADSYDQLVNSIRKSHGKKLYFIVTGNFIVDRAKLVKDGFVEWKDFVNGTLFASEINGVPMNTYPLIKAL